MAFKLFKKQYLDSKNIDGNINLLRVINSLQQSVETSINSIIDKFQNDSIILTNISLEANKVNLINHTLGRNLTGWQIIRKRSKAEIWDSQDNNKSPNLTLYLQTSDAVVVDLLVF